MTFTPDEVDRLVAEGTALLEPILGDMSRIKTSDDHNEAMEKAYVEIDPHSCILDFSEPVDRQCFSPKSGRYFSMRQYLVLTTWGSDGRWRWFQSRGL